MKRRNVFSLSLITTLGLALLPATSGAQQKTLKDHIVGTWKLTDHANKLVATGAMEHPYGKHPNGLQLFSKSGQMMFSMYRPDRKAPAGKAPTPAEKAALFDTELSQIGTYSVDGNKIAIHYNATNSQTDAGTDRSYTAELNGNKLTVTAQPFTRAQTGEQIISIRTFERID